VVSGLPRGLLEALRAERLEVAENVPLAPWTTFRIGGPAAAVVTVRSPEEAVRAVRSIAAVGARWTAIGGGSNLLVPDEGYDGVVLLMRAARVQFVENDLEAEAGAELGRLVSASAWAGLGDLTFAAGIPGTIGGAVVGNAGAWGRAIGECVASVRVLRARTLETAELSREALGFDYRSSALQTTGDLVLSVRLALQPADRRTLLRRIDEVRADRARRLPEEPCAGSFFRNLPPVRAGEPREPAGRLLEAVGAKGLRVGDAAVSERHANVIVNLGHARCRDVLALAEDLERRVAEKFGVRLVREVRLLT